jgi:tripartite-type tricarboxylate transporter receptor subunit TctC
MIISSRRKGADTPTGTLSHRREAPVACEASRTLGRMIVKLPRRRFLHLAAVAAALPTYSRIARAQNYPSRFVRIVVPFPPGGSADPVARILAARLSEIWGQQVVAENKAGAGGNIAAVSMTQSAADGYTLFCGGDFLATNRYLYSPTIDPITDLTPVTLICTYANVMVVPKTSPAKSVVDFIEYCKNNPGKVTFASSGTGASPHLNGELFKRMAGVEMTHVPYRGGGPAINDLIPGRVDVMFATTPSARALVDSGAIRALAVTSAMRSPFLSDIPSIAESGVPGFDVSSWYALFLPPKTPAEIVGKVYIDAVAAIADPQTKQRFADIGTIAGSSTPAQLTALLKSELDKWGPVIKELGIKPD